MKFLATQKAWLFTLLGLFSLTSLIAQCEASYIFGFVDENTVLFYNNSENYSGQKWEFEDGISLEDNTPLVTRTFESDTNRVCLRVWTESGCEDIQCFDIYPGAPNEMCHVSDCVWPGDANMDTKANNLDILTLGLGFGSLGPQRPFYPDPANPIAWIPNFSDNWANSTSSINGKHLDCDGNGLVDDGDITAIEYNYVPETDVYANTVAEAPMVQFNFHQDSIFYYNVSDQDTFEIGLDIILGSAFMGFENLYGFAFEFNYPDHIVGDDAISIEYNTNSFLGDDSEVISFGKDVPTLSRYDVAITRTSGISASGSGNTGTITFIINSDIIGGYADPHLPFELDIIGFTANDENGNPIAFDLPEEVSMIIVRDIVANQKDDFLTQQIQIFPNPVSDELWIETGSLEAKRVVIYDILGQQWIVDQIRASTKRIPVGNLPSGIYLIRIYTDEGTLTKQIHVE